MARLIFRFFLQEIIRAKACKIILFALPKADFSKACSNLCHFSDTYTRDIIVRITNVRINNRKKKKINLPIAVANPVVAVAVKGHITSISGR